MKLLDRNCALAASLMLGAVVVNGQSFVDVLNVPLPGSSPRIEHSFGRRPLAFEPNVGQTDAEVKFLARGKGYQLFLTQKEAVMVLQPPTADESAERLGVRQPSAALWDGFGFCENREFTELSNTFENGAGAPHSKTLTRGMDAPGFVESSPSLRHSGVLRIRLVGSEAAPTVRGEERLPGKANYFIGNNPACWRTNVPTFGRVQLAEVYPGIDLVYYGNEGQLEYDFVLAPGANPNQIAMEFEGSERLELDTHGDLIAWVEGRAVRWRKPVVYQESDGQRVEVAGAYRLNDASLTYQADAPRRIGFELAAYDPAKPLVIDPVLVYSTYLGGSGNDGPGYGARGAIAADQQGNACVVGNTDSLNFPVKNALQPRSAGGMEAFVTKLSRSGQLLFSTYLGGFGNVYWGGLGNDFANAVALDLQGNIHVAGATVSTNFPLVKPLQATLSGQLDGFVAILSPDGEAISFSTYWGGTSGDAFNGVAVDATGNIYLAGWSGDRNGAVMNDFPIQSALQTQPGGGEDAVVVKLEAGGKGVIYSTYFGGGGGILDGGEFAYAIAAEAEGYAYIVGTTTSYDLPVVDAYQPGITGDLGVTGSPYPDFFYARIKPDGSGLVYGSYFGSYGLEGYPDLALGPHGELWLAGQTQGSSEGLATPGSFQTSFLPDSFGGIVARFNATNGVLEAATYLQNDMCGSIAVDAAGDAWVGGSAGSGLALVDPLQSSQGGGDAFVAKLSSDCSRLLFSTYFGGSGSESSPSLCLDPEGNALLFGNTGSKTNFPLVNAFQTNLNGTADAFVAKISLSEVLKISRTGQMVNLSWPARAANYILEATTVLPTDSWTTVTTTPTVTTNEHIVQLPMSGNAQFFRLRKQ